MSASTIIDLTALEDEVEDIAFTFLPEVPRVRNAFNDLKISNPLVTPPSMKRKRSKSSVDCISVSKALPVSVSMENPGSQESSVVFAAPLKNALMTTSAGIPTPESTPTKKAKSGPKWSDATTKMVAIDCGDETHNKPRREQPQTQTIDLTLEDSEEAIAQISRAFPASGADGPRRASRLELLANPIQVAEDEDSVSMPSNPSESNLQHDFAESLTSDDSLSDQDLRRWLHNVQVVEEAEKEAQVNERVELEIFRGTRFTCAPGKAVELEDGSFLHIKKVTKDGKGLIFLSGRHLVRQNFLGLKMPKRKNEVVWLQQVARMDRSDHLEQHEVSVSQVRKNREVIFTNNQFPNVSSRTDQDSLLDTLQDVELGPLFCRWKMTVISGPKDRIIEESIEHLRFEDADDKVRRTNLGQEAYARIADMRTRFNWRKIPTIPGGSRRVVQQLVDLDNKNETAEYQAYTFGDAFCGGGGTSRGALDAGLFVRWGFDIDEQAITSYHLNFSGGGTDCRHEAVHEFLQAVYHDPPIVDVLHVSPPCQPFSHAHTWESNPERDAVNQAALFSVWHLVETLKPRAVTVEETDAIMSRHKEWFSALINIFVNLGYSVRWATLRCQNYAVPQTRKRLFIIASGPGEKLPPMPPITHEKDSSAFKPLVTINDMISNIPRNAADHDPNFRPDFKPRVPFAPHTQARTITTKGSGGGDTYHPSGTRPFTIRELASLQTFPVYHSFAGARGITARKHQIGNAVPPVLARALFRTIIKSLKESDGIA